MNVILFEPDEVDRQGEVTMTGPRARHVLDVLKAGSGQTVRVGVLNGSMGFAAVTASTDRSVSLRCTFTSQTPSPPRVDLLLALPRPKVLRRLWAQLAALGVGQIVLTNAERVERNYFDTHVLSEACYRPLLIEGLQQARDTWLPRVSIHKQFRILVEDDLTALFPSGHRLVAHPGSATTDMRLAGIGSSERVLLAVGPEGGWNAFELNLLSAHGFLAFDMGGRTLRTDTACIALVALVHSALRESERPSGSDSS
ncbi:MAG TPA: RsmE family RNA methyltransferase [Vicinamibacterales bacterium]